MGSEMCIRDRLLSVVPSVREVESTCRCFKQASHAGQYKRNSKHKPARKNVDYQVYLMLKKELTRNTRLHKRRYGTAACSVGVVTPGLGNRCCGLWALVAGLGLFARILYNVFID